MQSSHEPDYWILKQISMDRNWRSRGKLRECNTHKYVSNATSGAGMQHGSHINISLQFFSQTNHAEKFMREVPCRDRYLQR
jgi:hypothetical protein